MPDRDVFNRNVHRGWQSASRRMLATTDDPEALASVVRALAKLMREGGCPGFDQIIGTVVEAWESSAPEGARQTAVAKLDYIRLHEGNSATEIAIASARRFLPQGDELPHQALVQPTDRDYVATRVLAEVADAYLCPASLLGELVESGELSYHELRSRRERAKSMICASPEARRLAAQLLSNPSGTSVQMPRSSGVKPSQAEILVVALTK
jgi:hypothetical protein